MRANRPLSSLKHFYQKAIRCQHRHQLSITKDRTIILYRWPESRTAAMGGVTSSINYIDTGQYYLYDTVPYKEFSPKVLDASADKFHVDYAYHLAPIMYSHRDEIEMLIEEFGVTSFKIFMFYGSHRLHGKATKNSQN